MDDYRETIPAGAVLPVSLMATVVNSPRAMRRRRREIELEARRLATADYSSSDSSPPRESSDDARPAPMLIRTKAHSASPNHQIEEQRRDRRKQRRSYRQYIRDKRSRSRDKARAASADRHRVIDDQSQDPSSLSQVSSLPLSSILSHVHTSASFRSIGRSTRCLMV